MGFEEAVMRNLSREMVIEITYACSAAQRAEQCAAVCVQRNVEHCQLITGCRRHLCKQCYITFHPGYQGGGARFGEPQLVKRADSVGVAIEDVIEFHAAPYVEDRQSRPGSYSNFP